MVVGSSPTGVAVDNRRKETVVRKLVALLLVMMGITLLNPVAPAYAVAGCNSNVQDRGEVRAENFFTQIESIDPIIPRFMDIRLTANIIYQWCPNGSGTNKLKPKRINWCWTILDNKSIFFDGVKFNAYIFDDNEVVNPQEFKVGDDGTIQNCGLQDIALDREKWLEMPNSPGYTAQFFIVMIGQPDRFRQFENPRIKYFHPDNDVVLSGWYN